MPPSRVNQGTRWSWKPSSSASPSIGKGECASTRSKPASRVRRTASINRSGRLNSATRPNTRWSGPGSCTARLLPLLLLLEHRLLDLERRDHRQEAHEQKKQREEHAEHAGKERPVPEGRVIALPRRDQPVAVERG